MVDIAEFVRFTGTGIVHDELAGSRFKSALTFVGAAEADQATGPSGLTRKTEQVIESLLDRREFGSDVRHGDAARAVQEALGGLPIEVRVDDVGGVEIVSTRRERGRRVLDERVRTAFGTVLEADDLSSARRHFTKAKGFLEGRSPDYENACKEAVCTIESLATAMTGEKDLPAAIKKAAREGLIPRPLDDMIIKVYAYRGNEPGVGHGQASAPTVRRAEAELLVDQAAVLGRYLKVALASESPASDPPA